MDTLDIKDLTADDPIIWKNTVSGVDHYYRLISEAAFFKLSHSLDGDTWTDVLFLDGGTAAGSIFLTGGNPSAAGVAQYGLNGDTTGGNVSNFTATVYGSAAPNTGFGVNLANWSRIRAGGANSNGLIIGNQFDDPIIFGRASQKDISIPSGGIVEYADNAAALAAGKTAGDLYRTADVLKIVHA